MDRKYLIVEAPKFVGYWVVGGEHGLHIAMVFKPRWLTRVLCKWLLEWNWTDGEIQ